MVFRDSDGDGVLTSSHIVYGSVSDANLEAVVAIYLTSLVTYSKIRSVIAKVLSHLL
jgi:hypothetical protein